jgi:hypothetical protein
MVSRPAISWMLLTGSSVSLLTPCVSASSSSFGSPDEDGAAARRGWLLAEREVGDFHRGVDLLGVEVSVVSAGAPLVKRAPEATMEGKRVAAPAERIGRPGRSEAFAPALVTPALLSVQHVPVLVPLVVAHAERERAVAHVSSSMRISTA